MKLVPLGEWVVVKPVEAAPTRNGLWIPHNAEKEQYLIGTVVEKGAVLVDAAPLGSDILSRIMPGDMVVYDKVGSVTVRIGNEEHVLVKAREIVGVVTL